MKRYGKFKDVIYPINDILYQTASDADKSSLYYKPEGDFKLIHCKFVLIYCKNIVLDYILQKRNIIFE